ncbi:MAG: phosphopantetheine-binding protein [Patescibacteria group bacterium]|jgi:acyl carrier protein
MSKKLTREEIENQLIELFKEKINKNQADKSALLVADLRIDSLDQFEIILKIEKNFKVYIPDEEAEEIYTIKSAADWLEGRL